MGIEKLMFSLDSLEFISFYSFADIKHNGLEVILTEKDVFYISIQKTRTL